MARGIEPTVGNFFLVLSSLLTQYDEKECAREQKRGGRCNIYRLGHLLGTMQKAEDEILARHPKGEPMTKETAEELAYALADRFTVNSITNKFDLPPLKKFHKQLEAFVETGKRPSPIDR